MFRLETLGRLALCADAEPLRTTQRRRLALLALLAVAGERGLSRDKLQAYLWPERPPEHARHALEQLLHVLRGQLGDDVLLGTNPVALNPPVIASDVGDFQRALEQGALEDAVGLYQGPFLDGFFLSDAPEFERWVEAERGRLAQSCMSALESLAHRDAERAPAAALEWWRRLVAMDPYATGPTLGLMGASAASGDPAGALKVARVHQTLVREELEAEPSPQIAALAEQIRAGRSIGSAPTLVPGALSRPAAPLAHVAPASGGSEATAARSAVPSTRPRRRTVRFAAGAAVIIGLAIAATRAVDHGRRDDRPITGPGPPVLIVAPFGVSETDSALAPLREGLVDLLSARLTGEGGPIALDARTALKAWRDVAGAEDGGADLQTARHIARSLGANLIVIGDAVRDGESELVLNSTLLDANDGRVRARATVRGALDSVSVLVDHLAIALLALHAGEGEARLASLTSAPLPAVRTYLAGRAAYRHGEYQNAVTRFERALELDSTFALAALELASAAELRMRLRPIAQAVVANGGWWSERDTAWSRGVEIAWRERDRLPSGDRHYLETLRGSSYPNPTPALTQLRNWEHEVEVDPERADAWYRFGALLLAQGPAIDVPDARERARIAFERAVVLDSEFVAPLGGLVEVAASARDTTALRQLGALYLAHDSAGDDAGYIRWRVATLTGDAAGLRRLRDRFDSIAPQSLARIQWTSQMDGIALEDAERAIAALIHRAGDLPERTRAIAQARWLALNRGRPQAALRFDDSVVNLEGQPYWGQGYRILYALYWDGDTSAAAAEVPVMEGNRRAMIAAPGAPAGLASALVRPEQWRLWHGDWSLTPRFIALLRQAAASDSASSMSGRQADMLEAILASQTGRSNAGHVLEHLDSLARQGCCVLPHYTNLIIARLRERAGDLPGALRAARRARWVLPPEYLSTSLREEGRIAARMGDRDAAIRAYRHFLVLQDSVEASRRDEVERVRAELKRLESPAR